MTGDNRRFVDANVLVYANLLGSMHHAAASMMLQQADAAGDELWISSQIMREYLAVVTRPQPGGPPPLTMPAAVDQVRLMLQRFQVVGGWSGHPRSTADVADRLSGGRTSGARRQHCRDDAGQRHHAAADVQYCRLPPLRRPDHRQDALTRPRH